jgi:serine/threonine protein kinase
MMTPVGNEIGDKDFNSEFALQLLRLLRLLDRMGIVHRDLRPANLLQCGGRLLVIDWAFAVDKTTESPEQVCRS